MAKEKVSQSDLMKLLGVTGLSIWRGAIGEEYLTQLKGTRASKVFREMTRDAVISTLLDAIKMPLLAAEFMAVPASDVEADKKAADFLWECMNDMTGYSWRQHVLDMLDFLTFGWSVAEIVLKKREGRDAERPSKFNDGKLGIHILDPRGQETLENWVMDSENNVEELVQRDPVLGKLYHIPRWKMVHATFRSRKRSPEGSSPMAQLYRAWYMRSNLEVLEGIGIERDLAGLPVIWLPYGATATDKDNAEEIVRHLRMDEESGLVMPPPKALEGEYAKWGFELASGGGKQYNTGETIMRWNKIILMRFFAQFLLLGMEQVGTQALVKGSQDFFSLALKSIQQELLECWNDQLVPLLFSFNSFPGMTDLPTIDWADSGKADLPGLADFLQKTIGSAVITSGAELEDYVRDLAGLPERPEGVGEGERLPRAVGQPATTFELQGRRGRSKREKMTNDYQEKLVDIYDKWSKKVQAEVLKAQNMGTKAMQLAIDQHLEELGNELKEAGRKGIRDAVLLGMRGIEPDPSALRIIAERVEENDRFIDESLLPGVQGKLHQQIVDLTTHEMRFYQLDEIALQGAFAVLRVRVAGYSGGVWSATFIGAQLWGKEKDQERLRTGEKPRRVKWVLDPEAQHCEASPGFHGCIQLAGIYDSFDHLPTMPAGSTTCRGNCRCSLQVEVAPNVWETV